VGGVGQGEEWGVEIMTDEDIRRVDTGKVWGRFKKVLEAGGLIGLQDAANYADDLATLFDRGGDWPCDVLREKYFNDREACAKDLRATAEILVLVLKDS
jgi:hypothetical protein